MTPFADARILIVDDEKANVDALVRIVQVAGYSRIHATTDPTEALGLFQQHDPDVVLLDLHMKRLSGLSVLQQLRTAAGPHVFVPVLVLTGDSSSQARSRALSAGATDFLTKPLEVAEVVLRIRNLLETRYLHREIVIQNQQLEERVRQRTVELEGAYLDTLERLASAAEFRDDETGRHTERVGEVAAVLGGALGLPDEDLFLLRRAAPLHDVGKIGIPDAILRKPGPLTSDEWEIMKTHTTIGARILAGGQSRVVQLAEEIALYHHEQWNGEGYPTGIAGEAIPLPARLVMVADVFDALTSNRVYRDAWSAEKVLDYIRQYAGQRFDPRIAALCERADVRRILLGVRESDSRPAEARKAG
ncbi:MAG TPA: HD domain-containing phosphohydrolase [Gemmatimonadales bacterium]|nr:HD domain-containing phosphohydrolase [Gemmatimonadales bacterium]